MRITHQDFLNIASEPAASDVDTRRPGGVHGHHVGARALRRAVDPAVVGQPPESATENCPELPTALDW